MSYFKNEVLFIPIPYTGWEPVQDYLCQQYQEPVTLKGTYETMEVDHVLLYVVSNPYERMIRSLFTLGKINETSTKEEVFSVLQFCPTQFSYVSRKDKLTHAKILHAETLNEDMNALGYDFHVDRVAIPYMNYLHHKSIHAINTFYEKDFEMFSYKKVVPIPKRPIPQTYTWKPHVKTDAVIFICSFGGSLLGNKTPVGEVSQVHSSAVHTFWESHGIPPSTLYVYGEEEGDSTQNIMDCSILGAFAGCTIVLCIFSPYDSMKEVMQRMFSGMNAYSLLKPTHICISWETEPYVTPIVCAGNEYREETTFTTGMLASIGYQCKQQNHLSSYPYILPPRPIQWDTLLPFVLANTIPHFSLPSQLRIHQPYTIGCPFPATYHIKHKTIAIVNDGIIYPKQVGTTYLYAYILGKVYKVILMVVPHPRFSFALTT